MFVLPQRTPGPARLGVTVSRRVGGAVVRNRVRRRVREVFRLHREWFADGRDVVFVALPRAAELDFDALFNDMKRLAARGRARS